MFRGLFKKHEEDEDIFEVDPVVEQRRKEKFSTPLIYDEEFKEEPEVTVTPTPKTKEKTKVVEAKPKVEEKPRQIYQMSEVISPMMGITKGKNDKKAVKPTASSKPKKRKNVDQLVPVISPFFGNYEEKEQVESEAKLTTINDEPK